MTAAGAGAAQTDSGKRLTQKDSFARFPESNLGLIIGCVAAAAAAAALVLAIVGILVFLKKTEKRELVPRSDPSA